MANNKNSIVRKVIKLFQNLPVNLKNLRSEKIENETNKIYNKLVNKAWLSTEKPPKFDVSGWSPDKQAWHDIKKIVERVRRKIIK